MERWLSLCDSVESSSEIARLLLHTQNLYKPRTSSSVLNVTEVESSRGGSPSFVLLNNRPFIKLLIAEFFGTASGPALKGLLHATD